MKWPLWWSKMRSAASVTIFRPARACSVATTISRARPDAGVAENEVMTLSVDAVERTFDRLALVINGRPAHFESYPTATISPPLC